ncbi:hypothetical protein HZC34_06940, partial [Candidatus Saganbacteria bacterium]|nr:hypothetical protein [Candidatus Saganbacteria bacterium]
MDFKRFLWRLMVFIFILGTISGIAGANLTVTLPKVTTQDLIDLFWSGDANTADLVGRTISANPT